MEPLKRTDNYIYYIYDYVPTRLWENGDFTKEQINASKNLLNYKSFDKMAMKSVTERLTEAIYYLTHHMRCYEDVALIAIPPSKVGKTSAIQRSITWIAENYVTNRHLMDCGDMLVRTKDMESQHLGRRATYEEQKETIACKYKVKDKVDKKNITYILLDDVTTSGGSMKVCEDIIRENEGKSIDVFNLVVSKTVSV